MTHEVQKAICIQPKAPDLGFLNDVRNFMSSALVSRCQAFRLKDPRAEKDARRALEESSLSFVAIFAHGGSDYVRGGHYRDRLSGGTYVEHFFERKDLGLFRDKVVFCMSCQSAALAADAVKAGAIAFVGFDEVPFLRVDVDGKIISGDKFTIKSQRLIADAVNAFLRRFLSGKLTFRESVDYLRLWICQKAVSFVRESRNGSDRREIAALLLKIKDGIQYEGEEGVRFR